MISQIKKSKWNKTFLDVPTGWKGLENYMPSIIDCFNIKQKSALEFGVDSGYSLHILSQLFDNVTGVDLFESDEHIGHIQGDEFYEGVMSIFSQFNNTKIVRQDFREYIKTDTKQYDLIHVDIVHLYDQTYQCAEWSIFHSNVIMLHDTISYSDVNQVCLDLSKKYNLGYYNICDCHGLGILYKKEIFQPSSLFSPLRDLLKNH